MIRYNPQKIEKKWQKKWYAGGLFKAQNSSKNEKFYILDEFPYPSGDGLHIGHCRPYIGLDVVARKRRMQGQNVLYPMGWDAFGLPTENYAIKKGVHPSIVTKKNTDNFRKQMKNLGLSFDWSREVNTTDPKYYKWTQWIFIKLFENGLAYKDKLAINWCPSCKIGLANEEVINGKCERCGTPVEKREKEQWLIKITKYADRLINDLAAVDYQQKIKDQQINWIGRSEGINIDYKVKNVDKTISIFTTRPDTNFGATFLVTAPDSKFTKENLEAFPEKEKVKKYIKEALAKSDIDRTATDKKKTGVFTGWYAINNLNNKEMPIYVGDFVLGHFGTGCVVGVPGHDVRDFEFAKAMDLEVIRVVVGKDGDKSEITQVSQVQEENGTMINSGFLDGKEIHQATKLIMDYIVQKGWGKKVVNYKLRDWVFSRQHYWGEPIPMIYCEKCALRGGSGPSGWQTVPEKDLPVELPKVKKYQPTDTGESPLAVMEKWVNVECPKCVEDNKKTKYLIFDFDGVIADTLEANIEARINVGWAKDRKESEQKMWQYFTRRPYHANGHTLSDSEIKKLIADFFDFGMHVKKHGYELFDNFIKEIKTLKNTKIAVVSSGSKVYVLDGVKKSKLKYDSVLTCEDSLSKEDKIIFLAKKWKVDVKDMYYFTDSSADVYELQDMMDKKKIIGCAWGYVGFDELKKVLPENQILKNAKSIQHIFKPGIARRETDTMPNWAGSNWYYLAYTVPGISNFKFQISNSPKYISEWMPVDWYNGGMEHTTLHLLYSRFIFKFLWDIGAVPKEIGNEPYRRRTSHGIVLAEGGVKMSKSKGNVINPDDVVKQYGADTLRVYGMFMGPFEQMIPWDTKGIVGARRFLEKIYVLVNSKGKSQNSKIQVENQKLTASLNKTIKKVSEDIEAMKFNTAISAMMSFVNEWSDVPEGLNKQDLQKFLAILSPFAPHLAAELGLRAKAWPAYEEVAEASVMMIVSVNGKVRDKMEMKSGLDQSQVEGLVLHAPKIKPWLESKQVRKIIFVPNKLINIVV